VSAAAWKAHGCRYRRAVRFARARGGACSTDVRALRLIGCGRSVAVGLFGASGVLGAALYEVGGVVLYLLGDAAVVGAHGGGIRHVP